jgi:hypothetical protein
MNDHMYHMPLTGHSSRSTEYGHYSVQSALQALTALVKSCYSSRVYCNPATCEVFDRSANANEVRCHATAEQATSSMIRSTP